MKALTNPLFLALAAATLTLTLATAEAQNLRVPLGQQGDAAIEVPRRGATMDQVNENFGDPLRRAGPVGDPPISVWDYEDFSVYFEGRIVLHSVRRQEP